MSEFLDLTLPNTPLMAFTMVCLLFNSVESGRLRVSNLVSNIFLFGMLGFSNSMYGRLDQPLLGAQVGFVSSLFWTVGRPLRLVYTQRFLSTKAHYAVGSTYMAYHLYRWRGALTDFEDAGEDVDGDF